MTTAVTPSSEIHWDERELPDGSVRHRLFREVGAVYAFPSGAITIFLTGESGEPEYVDTVQGLDDAKLRLLDVTDPNQREAG